MDFYFLLVFYRNATEMQGEKKYWEIILKWKFHNDHFKIN